MLHMEARIRTSSRSLVALPNPHVWTYDATGQLFNINFAALSLDLQINSSRFLMKQGIIRGER